MTQCQTFLPHKRNTANFIPICILAQNLTYPKKSLKNKPNKI